jgi:hypothetical protein
MNPAVQTQIFDPLRQQFVQVDGGELTTVSLLFQILVELRILNHQIEEGASGIVTNDELDLHRKDLLNEPGFSRQA